MKIGVNLPNFGSTASRVPLAALARHAEEAGFDSVWVSDHIVMPPVVTSPYPFSPDGRFPWPPDEPWYDPVIAMSFAAAATSRVEIGVGVVALEPGGPVGEPAVASEADARGASRRPDGARPADGRDARAVDHQDTVLDDRSTGSVDDAGALEHRRAARRLRADPSPGYQAQGSSDGEEKSGRGKERAPCSVSGHAGSGVVGHKRPARFYVQTSGPAHP